MEIVYSKNVKFQDKKNRPCCRGGLRFKEGDDYFTSFLYLIRCG